MGLFHYDYMIATNPPSSRSEESAEPLGHHVRLVPSSTVTGDQLVEEMHALESVLSKGTCYTALDALARALGGLLANGHAVNIVGIGTLHPRLAGDVVKTARGLTGQRVRISNVLFTPDAELLLEANKGKPHLFRRASQQPTEAQVSDFLREHFATHDTLTRKTVVKRLGITKYRALNLLHDLTEQGVLEARGDRATAHYVMAAAQN